MAAPLFLPDAEEVKKLLKLSEIPAGGSSEAAVFQAIEDTKVVLWEELGAVAIAELLSLSAPAGQPTSDDEFKYLLARRVELAIIRYNLTFSLPMGYRAGAVTFIESYSSEGAFRSLQPEELQKLRLALWSDTHTGIGRQLAFLKGQVLPGDATGVKAALIGGEAERQLLYFDPADPNDALAQFIT